jgi:hypothetical protein
MKTPISMKIYITSDQKKIEEANCGSNLMEAWNKVILYFRL